MAPIHGIAHLLQMVVAVRAVGTPASVAALVRQELRATDPNLPVVPMDTIDEQIDDLFVTDRLIANLAAFFGSLTLLLACLGLYGVMSFTRPCGAPMRSASAWRSARPGSTC